RTQIVQGVTQSSVEAVFEDPESEQAYQEAKNISQKYTHFLLENSEALKSIMEIKNTDQDLSHHGVTVASLAVKLANELGYTDKKQLELLALGASLHDFGLIYTTIDWKKTEANMTPEEIKEYKKHPSLGADMLKDKKHLDQSVLTIIMEHEERSNGKGFPQGLLEAKIDKMALIVGLCDYFDKLIFIEGLTKEEASKKLSFDAIGKYPLDMVNGLKQLLKNTV
ncbi:MAG: HD domain-containing protein, partial [Bdellovibrionales bacterium]|nr:HD domain-containing protein [Bdellovibrionales bacterium]